jgi:N-acetylneuraminic acid mutarotase
MTLCDDCIIIFGGLYKTNILNGDVYKLSFNKERFFVSKYEDNQLYFPYPRHSHSAVYDKINKRIYIFGGYIGDIKDINMKYSNDIWSIQFIDKLFFNKLASECMISPRCGHASFIHDNYVYIFGGYGIHKISQKMQILKDFYRFDVDKGVDSLEEILPKGGVDIEEQLYKIIQIDPDKKEYGFFCDDLSKFYILNLNTFNFTKIYSKFVIPTPRENYTLNRLADGRILLFGGMHESDTYKESYVLIRFRYYNEDHYSWNALDVYGPTDEAKDTQNGFNGHGSVILSNNHIVIHGGTQNNFNPIFIPKPKNEPLFTSRLKILDIYNTYNWDKPIGDNLL